MSIDDVGKKARYARKPPIPQEIARPAPIIAQTPAAPAATVAAKRALGFADDVTATAPKTAGAKSAVHGLSFLERTSRSMKKGLLVALMGLQLAGSAQTSPA